MNFPIELHPLALEEMNKSCQWYEDRSEGLGYRFVSAIQKRFDRISEMPELYPRKKGNFGNYR